MSAGHPGIIAAEERLGEALTDEGKAQEAEPLLRGAAKAAHSSPFPLLPWQIAETENALGACLAKLGRTAEAQTLLRASRPGLRLYPQVALRQRALKRVSDLAPEQ